jgi:hypothetical protein
MPKVNYANEVLSINILMLVQLAIKFKEQKPSE